MSKADDKARRMKAEQAAKARRAAGEAIQRELRYREKLERELRSEIRSVLRELEQRNFPEMLSLDVKYDSRNWFVSTFIGTRTITRAAWQVGSFTYTNIDVEAVGGIYLLSNGSLAINRIEATPDRCSTRHIAAALKGIRELRARL